MLFNMTGGGGAGLNFKLIAVASDGALPAPAAENTIALFTETEINGYAFSASEPEGPAEGMVWIRTGLSSRVAFNALKKNCIMLYPLKCKQYIDGAWNDRVAQSYINGEWIEWYAGQLYENGDEYADITGGIALGTQDYSLAEKKADHILLGASQNSNSAYSHATCYTANPIELTSYKTLKAVLHTEKYGTLNGNVKVGITDFKTNFAEPTEYRYTEIDGTVESSKVGDLTLSYDISDVSGSYYVGVIVRANTTKVYAIILE